MASVNAGNLRPASGAASDERIPSGTPKLVTFDPVLSGQILNLTMVPDSTVDSLGIGVATNFTVDGSIGE